MRITRVGRVVAAVVAAVLAAAPVRAQSFEGDAPPRFLLDRVEVGGGFSRMTFGEEDPKGTTDLSSFGVRVERWVSPVLRLGVDGGRIERSGDPGPVFGDGTTGSVYFVVDDQDLSYSGGLNFNVPSGFPFFNGSARLGPVDDLHISGSYARSLPNFSGDDVEVGMGTGVFEDAVVWVGASMPISRDVVTFKARTVFHPVRSLEVTATGRVGKTLAGRLAGGSLAIAYHNPEPPQSWPSAGLGRVLTPEPGRIHYIGAGAITGAIGGVLIAGAADQQPLGEAAFRSAVYGVIVGGLLGAVFGNAMW